MDIICHTHHRYSHPAITFLVPRESSVLTSRTGEELPVNVTSKPELHSVREEQSGPMSMQQRGRREGTGSGQGDNVCP